MINLLIILVLLSLLVPAYTYFIYPLLLRLIRFFYTSPPPPISLDAEKSSGINSISVLISAYNEETNIVQRLQNLQERIPQDIPCEILIGSDCSSDATDQLVLEYPWDAVKHFRSEERTGKPGILNHLVKIATGDILIFTDANTDFQPGAIESLLTPYIEANVGAVCGKLIFTEQGKHTEENTYWRWENKLKQWESDIDSCLGVNGGIFSARRDLVKPFPNNTIVEDFVIGMRVREQGFRVIYNPNAIAYEEAPEKITHEFTRRTRIGAGDFQALLLCRRCLMPFYGFFAFSFWSHKVLRWLVPFFLIFAFIGNLGLAFKGHLLLLFFLQLIFYLFSAIDLPQIKPFAVMRYFVIINSALFIGFFRFLLGVKSGAWTRTPRT